MPLPAGPRLESRDEAAKDAERARRRSSLPFLSLPLLVAAATGALLAYLFASLVSARPGHDQSWLLYAAGRMLAGAHLDGPTLIETNPPLIVWFSAIPSLLATRFHASPGSALTAVVSILIGLSALWSTRILRAARLLATPTLTGFAFAAIAALEASTSVGDFGQREQLLVILLSPYLLYGLYGDKTRIGLGERVALGIAAGLAICFKPQQILTLICFELFLLLLTRRPRRLLRIELLALALTPCIYLLLVRIATPRYLTEIVPVLRDTYWAFGTRTIPSLLHDNLLLDGLSILSLVAWIALRRHLRHPYAPAGFLAAGFGGALAFCIQRTSWHYQFFPWKVFVLVSLVCMALDLLSSRPTTAYRSPLLLASCVVLFAIIVVLPVCLRARRPLATKIAEGDPYLKPTLGLLPPNTPVYIFATTVEGFDFVLPNHLIWGSRYAHLWMLPAIVRNETGHLGDVHKKPLSTSRLHQLESLQRSNTTEDLHIFRPSVVLVERCSSTYRCPELENTPTDILAWFNQSPAFAAEWANYRPQSSNERYDIYTRIP